ncbi:WbqC family protein [Lutibacter sp. B1]|uniref:WbqC family protein n=1 Tax=Lutibacter sp. B1 TaxID=2725996 RepID=UPI0014568714|nr:WbqC family protein [Lutibacter sp. B1]NLP56723.1 WbqC family protein [Lutibacter sp. B1]
MVLLQPTYFSPIIQYVAITKSDKIVFETEDNFQKQTYRNRCYIYTADGKHLLNIPIQHNKGIKQKTKDVKIDYKDNWNKQHLKTLKTAYSSSPFFEFYIDDLLPVFEKRYTYLLDLNLLTHQIVMDALQIEVPFIKTKEYITETQNLDLRYLAIAKNSKNYNLNSYIQVFYQSHNFLPNLSILDLLFMEGPNALNYLESQQITF